MLTPSRVVFDADDVHVVSRVGSGYADTELVSGVVLDANPVTVQMPRQLSEINVALLPSTVNRPQIGSRT